MFSEQPIVNEQTLSAIEQFGEHMPGGFFICKADESEELLYANTAVCRLFGCDSPDAFRELTGSTFRGMVHPEDYEKIISSVRPRIDSDGDGPGDLDMEYRIVRKDGEIRWVEVRCRRAASDVHKGLCYGFIRDVTDRHREEESDKDYGSAVIEALTRAFEAVWLIKDLQTQSFELYRIDGTLVHLLPAYEAVKITRFPDAFAFYASKFVQEEDRQAFLEAVSPESIVRNTADGQVYSVRFRRLFETESRYYRLEFVKLDLDNGKTGIAAGFRDVDSVVRKEMIAQRTLREAVAAANAANTAKSNFLSSMSHEMRTPLNAIIGLDTLLLKNPALPQGARDQAEKIGISAQHLLELINNILDMNRIDEGSLKLNEEPFSLRGTIELVNAIIQNHCDEKGLSYQSSIVGRIDDCYLGDELNVKPVLINVLGNAAKYTIPPGTVSFTAEQIEEREVRADPGADRQCV